MDVFTYFRFVFWFLFCLSVIMFAVTAFQRTERLNTFGLGFLVVTIIGTSVILLGTEGFIVDAYALGGDTVTTYLCLATCGISSLAFVTHIWRGVRREKRQDSRRGY
ncbi:hypothetical protein [Exiguobacterium sp.]|uniref:hypothetical protein n=1 Tax=Exiguobacterium sp. TaxID=44751 RepID=UPI00263B02D5|nr:hypothetical protein [Exiguobacterium sp.]MCC5893392.1 hypothetical protein [Exiguobacterium sp.]